MDGVKSVLVIAEQPDTLVGYLQQAGLAAYSCTTTDLAARIAEKQGADVAVFFDPLEVGGKNNRDALREVVAVARVVLVADKTDEIVPYAAALGVRDFVFTPADPADVLHRVLTPATPEEAADAVAGVTAPPAHAGGGGKPEPGEVQAEEPPPEEKPRRRLFGRRKKAKTSGKPDEVPGDEEPAPGIAFYIDPADCLTEAMTDASGKLVIKIKDSGFCYPADEDAQAAGGRVYKDPHDVPEDVALIVASRPHPALPEGVPVAVYAPSPVAETVARQTHRLVIPLEAPADKRAEMILRLAQGKRAAGVVYPPNPRLERLRAVNRRMALTTRSAAVAVGDAASLTGEWIKWALAIAELAFWATCWLAVAAGVVWTAAEAVSWFGLQVPVLTPAGKIIGEVFQRFWEVRQRW